jgi:hypothetical protein
MLQCLNRGNCVEAAIRKGQLLSHHLCQIYVWAGAARLGNDQALADRIYAYHPAAMQRQSVEIDALATSNI